MLYSILQQNILGLREGILAFGIILLFLDTIHL